MAPEIKTPESSIAPAMTRGRDAAVLPSDPVVRGSLGSGTGFCLPNSSGPKTPPYPQHTAPPLRGSPSQRNSGTKSPT
jgi:hypothetical protein